MKISPPFLRDEFSCGPMTSLSGSRDVQPIRSKRGRISDTVPHNCRDNSLMPLPLKRQRRVYSNTSNDPPPMTSHDRPEFETIFNTSMSSQHDRPYLVDLKQPMAVSNSTDDDSYVTTDGSRRQHWDEAQWDDIRGLIHLQSSSCGINVKGTYRGGDVDDYRQSDRWSSIFRHSSSDEEDMSAEEPSVRLGTENEWIYGNVERATCLAGPMDSDHY